MAQAQAAVLGLILWLFHLVLAVIVAIEDGARHVLARVGIAGSLQQAVLAIVLVALIVAAVRVTGRLFGLLIAVFLVLLLLHVLLPGAGHVPAPGSTHV